MLCATEDVLAGKRFLVAEDNAFAREALCEMLAAHGAAPVAAADGTQAVKLFALSDEGWFDAAIFDVCMPGADGFAAASAIRQMDRRDAGQLPIFAQTAALPRYAMREAENSGIDACLQKPVNMIELAQVLACAMGLGRIHGTA